MRSSNKIRTALDGWEGNVLTCYLDPVGIPTIGKGFTNRSKILTDMLGKLKPGVTKITSGQSDKIFSAMLQKEYEPFVNMVGAQQHEFDVGVSTVWNLGPKSQTWNWAKLWRAGKLTQAATYLATHYNTAAGRRLPGLVRRRREEAIILEHARYPKTFATISRPAPDGKPRNVVPRPNVDAIGDPLTFEAQELLSKLGIDPGKHDGWYGQKTKAAILMYQGQHPHMINDGTLGPATIAQLRREAGLIKKTVSKVVGTVSSTGAATWVAGMPNVWVVAGVGIVAIGAIAYFAYKYRDLWLRRRNNITGNIIET